MSHELCRECGGEGQVGMYRDGLPIVCTRCKGDGLEDRMDEMAFRADVVSDEAREPF